MKKGLIANIILACSLMSSGSVFADEAKDTVAEYALPEVNIVEKAPSEVIINVDDMENGASHTVPEMLRGASGVQVQMRPNAGGNEDLTVKLRGHDSRRYTVLVDGIPATMSGVMGGGYVDWNTVPLHQVEHIEVIKGAKSAAYGNTIGGVINIITKKNYESRGEVQLSAGSNARRRYLLNYYGNDGKDLSFGVHLAKDKRGAYLRNSDYKNNQLGLDLKWKVNDTDSLAIKYNYGEIRQGLVVQNIPGTPGYNGYYPTTVRTDGFASGGSGTVTDGSYGKIFRHNLNMSYQSKRKNGDDTIAVWSNNEKRHEIVKTTTGTGFDRYNKTDRSSGALYTGARNLGEKHLLKFGIDYRRLRYGNGWYNYNTNGASDLYPSQKVDTLGVFVEDTWDISAKIIGNLGIRYDYMRGDYDDARAASRVKPIRKKALSPKLNLTFNHDNKTATSLSVNRIWRAPSMAEFYWHSMGTGKLSSDVLNPETGWGYELGVKHKMNRNWLVSLTGYYQNVKDYINFTHAYPFNAYNIDAKLWGFELENSWQLGKTDKLFLNYTNQHTKKNGVKAGDTAGLSNGLDYRPRHMLSFGWTHKEDNWMFMYDMNFTGRQNASKNYPASGSSDIVELGGYTVHNVHFTYKFCKNSSVNLSVMNLFDREYCEIYGYPMEGRVLTATYTLEF